VTNKQLGTEKKMTMDIISDSKRDGESSSSSSPSSAALAPCLDANFLLIFPSHIFTLAAAELALWKVSSTAGNA
jgi:hypothetical protein